MSKVLKDGHYNYGVVGSPTLYRSKAGRKLFIGDTVRVEEGSYKGGTHLVVEEEGYAFIIGIRASCNSKTGDTGTWKLDFVSGYESLESGGNYDNIEVVEEDSKINNITEGEKVMLNKIEIGDKVIVIKRLVNPIANIEVGDTGVIERKDNDGDYKMRMDKDKDYWYVKVENIELIKDTQQFEIITEGTTTTVKIQGGRTGIAKLYYKDTYDKGFGIVQALGKALDIDLVEEVLKVTSGYAVLAAVNLASAKTIKGGTKIGRIVKDVYKFKAGDKVNIPTTKSTGDPMSTSGNVTRAIESGQGYMFFTGMYNGNYLLSDKDYKDAGDFFALEDLELYEEPKLGFVIDEPTMKLTDRTTGEVLFDGRASEYKNPILKEEVKPQIQVSSKVKMVSEHPDRGLERAKFGDVGIVMDLKENGVIKVDFPNHKEWSADLIDLELVIEPKEIITEESVKEEFKVGDYILFEGRAIGNCICKIKEIEGNSIKGYWADNIKVLPTTIKEFDAIEKQEYICSAGTCELKKLILIDDSEPILKVGDKVTKLQATDILKSGGKIIDKDGWIYFEENGILKFKDDEGRIDVSGGYSGNLNGYLEIQSLSKVEETVTSRFVVGQEVDDIDAELIVSQGGKVRNLRNKFEYYLIEGKLWFNSENGEKRYSTGYENFDGDRFEVIAVPKIFKDTESENVSFVKEEVIPEVTYEIGQELTTIEEATMFLNLGGKVKETGSKAIYYEKKHILKFKNLGGEKIVSNGYSYITLPVTIFKLPKTDNK